MTKRRSLHSSSKVRFLANLPELLLIMKISFMFSRFKAKYLRPRAKDWIAESNGKVKALEQFRLCSNCLSLQRKTQSVVPFW